MSEAPQQVSQYYSYSESTQILSYFQNNQLNTVKLWTMNSTTNIYMNMNGIILNQNALEFQRQNNFYPNVLYREQHGQYPQYRTENMEFQDQNRLQLPITNINLNNSIKGPQFRAIREQHEQYPQYRTENMESQDQNRLQLPITNINLNNSFKGPKFRAAPKLSHYFYQKQNGKPGAKKKQGKKKQEKKLNEEKRLQKELEKQSEKNVEINSYLSFCHGILNSGVNRKYSEKVFKKMIRNGSLLSMLPNHHDLFDIKAYNERLLKTTDEAEKSNLCSKILVLHNFLLYTHFKVDELCQAITTINL